MCRRGAAEAKQTIYLHATTKAPVTNVSCRYNQLSHRNFFADYSYLKHFVITI